MEHLVSIRPECLLGLRGISGGSGADEKGKGALQEMEAEARRMQNCGCGSWDFRKNFKMCLQGFGEAAKPVEAFNGQGRA